MNTILSLNFTYSRTYNIPMSVIKQEIFIIKKYLLTELALMLSCQ